MTRALSPGTCGQHRNNFPLTNVNADELLTRFRRWDLTHHGLVALTADLELRL